MPSSKAVARQPSTVPALAPTPASTITAEDIAIPTVYMGQSAQTQVGSGNAGVGDIYAAQSQDDSEADVLWEYVEPAPEGAGVLLVPLHMRKSWSYSPGAGQNLEMWPFEARGRAYPDGPLLDDPDPKKRAWLTYNFIILLPEVDDGMPYKTRFYRSGAPAATKINGIAARDPEHYHGFRWTTAKKSKQGVQPWYIPQLKQVELTTEQQESADSLLRMLLPGLESQASQAAADAPPAV